MDIVAELFEPATVPVGGDGEEIDMPRYRVAIDDGQKLDDSTDWLEFANDQAAIDEAQRALADMVRDNLPDGGHLEMRVAIENETREVIYQASLKFHGETAQEMKAETLRATNSALNGSAHRRR